VELLVLILAMFVRALFLQPKEWGKIQQVINIKVNKFVGENNVRLIILFAAALLIGYVVQVLVGRGFMNVLATMFFVYLFYVMYRDFPVITVDNEDDRIYLIEKLRIYDNEFEDTDQSIETLTAKLYSFSVENYFTSTLVLMLWYLLAGWLGLILYFFMYYLRFKNTPTWLLSVRHVFEIPVGVLGACSCAIAGRMDSVVTEMLSWRRVTIDNGKQMFEASVTASTNMRFEKGQFYKKFTCCKNLCLRSVYVWIFAVALVFIVV